MGVVTLEVVVVAVAVFAGAVSVAVLLWYEVVVAVERMGCATARRSSDVV